jgi:hypothetical protein
MGRSRTRWRVHVREAIQKRLWKEWTHIHKHSKEDREQQRRLSYKMANPYENITGP